MALVCKAVDRRGDLMLLRTPWSPLASRRERAEATASLGLGSALAVFFMTGAAREMRCGREVERLGGDAVRALGLPRTRKKLIGSPRRLSPQMAFRRELRRQGVRLSASGAVLRAGVKTLRHEQPPAARKSSGGSETRLRLHRVAIGGTGGAGWLSASQTIAIPPASQAVRRLRLLVADVERERPVGVVLISEVTASGPRREAWVESLSLPFAGRKTEGGVFEVTAAGCVPDSGLEPELMVRQLLVDGQLGSEIHQRFGEEPRMLVADEQILACRADCAGGVVDLGFGCSQYWPLCRQSSFAVTSVPVERSSHQWTFPATMSRALGSLQERTGGSPPTTAKVRTGLGTSALSTQPQTRSGALERSTGVWRSTGEPVRVPLCISSRPSKLQAPPTT